MPRRVVITGAGRGLGFEITKIHAEAGDEVYALTHSVTEELDALSKKHKTMHVLLCELTSESSIIKCSKEIKGNIETLYNVAGLYYETGRVPLEETDIFETLKMYEVNAMGPMLMLKYMGPMMRNRGLVVNVSSEAGSIGECYRDSEYGYCMSKAALNMFSKIYSNSVKESEIKVFCYHPGWLRTQMGGERAAASEDSISAKESADALMNLLQEFRAGESMLEFKDYTGKDWAW